LGTVAGCRAALVKAEHKGRPKGTLPHFPGGKQFPWGGQNHEADYNDLLMRAMEKSRMQKRGLRDCIELMYLQDSSMLLGTYQPSGQGLKCWDWL